MKPWQPFVAMRLRCQFQSRNTAEYARREQMSRDQEEPALSVVNLVRTSGWGFFMR